MQNTHVGMRLVIKKMFNQCAEKIQMTKVKRTELVIKRVMLTIKRYEISSRGFAIALLIVSFSVSILLSCCNDCLNIVLCQHWIRINTPIPFFLSTCIYF